MLYKISLYVEVETSLAIEIYEEYTYESSSAVPTKFQILNNLEKNE